MPAVRVILADDHAVLREGLALLINSQPGLKVVGQAGDGQQVLELTRALKPDVVVLDLSMPVLGGLDATRQLKADHPRVRVVALTMHEDESYLVGLLRAGADGYVLKRSASQLLIETIREVAAGKCRFDTSLSEKALVKEFRNEAEPVGAGRGLSDREEQVLRLLAWGYANKDVAGKLKLSVKTVETYRQRIADKLGLRGRVEIVQYAMQRGWMQQEP
jgi:DNA-binding NarL/FixJ family response regulator